MLGSEWSTQGIETILEDDQQRVTCRSSHLTSFAVLLNIRVHVDLVVSPSLIKWVLTSLTI